MTNFRGVITSMKQTRDHEKSYLTISKSMNPNFTEGYSFNWLVVMKQTNIFFKLLLHRLSFWKILLEQNSYLK